MTKVSVQSTVKAILDGDNRAFTSAEVMDLIPEAIMEGKSKKQRSGSVCTALWSLRQKREACMVDGVKTISSKWRDAADAKPVTPTLALPQPPKYGRARKHAQVLRAVIAGITGANDALDHVTELDSSVTQEEATRFTGDLSKQIRGLNRINNLLKERTR